MYVPRTNIQKKIDGELIDTPKGPMTRRQIAKAYKLSYNTVCRRLWNGWPIEKVISKPIRRIPQETVKEGAEAYRVHSPRYVSAYGYVTVPELSRIIDVDCLTLRTRLYKLGWSAEDALNTPVHGIRGEHFIMPPGEYRERTTRTRQLLLTKDRKGAYGADTI